MLTEPLAPYLLWAKTRSPSPIDLAGSNLLPCSMAELPGAREALDLSAPNDDGYGPLIGAIASRYGVDTTSVATATGCSGANFLAIAALVGTGDAVLIERPTYDPLVGACQLMGARIDRFERRFDDGYAVDLAAIEAAITPRTRLIILTTPHNPTGVTCDADTLRGLASIARRAGAYVLVDEVYLDAANAIADGSPVPAAAGLAEVFISTSSLTKSYGLAGLRCGWIVARPEVIARVRRTRDVVDNASSGPADRLAALAFSQLPALAARARLLLSANVDAMRRFLATHVMLEVAAPPCSSVVFPRIAGVADALPFVTRLRDDHGVAVAPGVFFDAPAHFRVSLAGDTSRLTSGLDKLSAALAEGVVPHNRGVATHGD